MVDYSKLSDQQINMLVAKLEYPDRKIIESMSRPPSVFVLGEINTWFDYCNNHSDALPILVNNFIGIDFDSSRHGELFAEWVTANNEHGSGYLLCDKSPRAEMIVFLMMQDAKNG